MEPRTDATAKAEIAGEPRRKRVAAWFRYFYFLRFSFFLWMFPVLLIGLRSVARALVSGLMVPEYWQGYVCVSFFVTSMGFAALVSARVCVINGEERLGDAAPEGLHWQPSSE
jgi:hypothetical protein